MPRTTFDPENRAIDPTQYPRLKLEKGERKRIVVIEKIPFYEYIHRLEMPKIGVSGQPIMENRERKDGTTYQVNAMDFVAQPLCLGDNETLKARGVDEKNCPACYVARNKPDEVGRPVQKFASHVLVYGTKHDSFEVSEPFTVQCIVWLYSEKRYNKLIDIKQEHELSSISEKDLCLGPCTNKNFQNFEIQIGGKAEWAQSEDRQQMAKTAFVENRYEDQQLREMIGRQVARNWMQEDLDTIHERWRQLAGGSGASMSQTAEAERASETGSLTEGLDSLLNDDSPSESPTQTVPLDSDPAEATVLGPSDAQIPDKGDEPVNFDDILSEFK